MKKNGLQKNCESIITNSAIKIADDITEPERKADAFKSNQHHSKLILDSAAEGIIALDNNGKHTFVNKAAAGMLGYLPEELLNAESRLVCNAEKNSSNENDNSDCELCSKVKKGITYSSDDNLFKRKDGSYFYADYTCAPIKEKNELVGTLITFRDVSEKKKDEAELKLRRVNLEKLVKERTVQLKDSKKMFETLSENSTDVIMRFDKELRHLYTNQSIKELTGIPAENFIGKTHEELGFPKYLIDLWEDAIENVFETKLKNEIEFQLPNGIWLDWVLIPEFDNDNSVKSVLTSARNITGRKTAENEIKRKSKLLQGVAEASAQFLLSDDIVTPIKKALGIIGIAAGVDRVYIFQNSIDINTGEYLINHRYEWTKETASAQIDNQDLQNIPYNLGYSRWYNELSNGRSINGLVKNFPDSEKMLLEVQDIISLVVIPIFSNKKFWGFIGFDDCINERIWSEDEVSVLMTLAGSIGGALHRNKIEENYKASERRWKMLFDYAPTANFIIDLEGIFIDENREAEKLIGYNKSELIGKNFLELNLLSSSNTAKAAKLFAENALGKPTQPEEFTLLHKDGTKVIAEIATYLTQIDGTNYIIGTAHDITERKRLEKNIKSALAREKELSDLKSNFISIASHEFRTPLTSILSSAELLEMFGKNWDDEKYSEHLIKIQNSVEHMTELIEDVLTVSKTENGNLQFVPEKFDLHQFCRALFDEAKLAADKDHEFLFNFNAEDKIVVMDKKLLRHILSNILSNAVKYTPNGGKVKFDVKSKGSDAVFKISDNGIGIPKEGYTMLYDAFFRAGNIQAISGTGLGLSIVKKSVDLHNGKIFFKSTLNKGTAFTITIPIK